MYLYFEYFPLEVFYICITEQFTVKAHPDLFEGEEEEGVSQK